MAQKFGQEKLNDTMPVTQITQLGRQQPSCNLLCLMAVCFVDPAKAYAKASCQHAGPFCCRGEQGKGAFPASQVARMSDEII